MLSVIPTARKRKTKVTYIYIYAGQGQQSITISHLENVITFSACQSLFYFPINPFERNIIRIGRPQYPCQNILRHICNIIKNYTSHSSMQISCQCCRKGRRHKNVFAQLLSSSLDPTFRHMKQLRISLSRILRYTLILFSLLHICL